MSPLFPNAASKSFGNGRQGDLFGFTHVWRDAPLLTGTTKFKPLPDVKNIMVTGGAGFIGSWLVRHLVETYPQYNIISYDKLDYCATPNNTHMLTGRSNFTLFVGDITVDEEVLRCLNQHNIDTIFHLAAHSHVDLSFGNSYQFTRTNVLGTHVLLECAKKSGIKRFIHMSTDEVYGEVKDGDEDVLESALLAPTNPYAASKAAAEMLVLSFQRSFRLPAIVVRSNNVYGPHQFPEKIVPKFTTLLNRKMPVVLHGDGSPTRRYLYAADAADALDTIFHRGEMGEVYNVGSCDELSNLDISGRILAEMDLPQSTEEEIRRWIKYTRDRPFNDCRYATNDKKLRKLGWKQKTSFAQGLVMTVEWYRRFGEQWWGDISNVLEPFPGVKKAEIVLEDEPQKITDVAQAVEGQVKKRKMVEHVKLNRRLTDCNGQVAMINGQAQQIAT